MTDDQEKKQIIMANLERAIEIAVLAHEGASDKSGVPYFTCSALDVWHRGN
jgi:(p)ppGpp synthase/HD superfamily hydrolase